MSIKTLCIFAKPPLPGKTKKRLAAEIGEVPAAELSQLMLNHLLAECISSNPDKIYLYMPEEFTVNDFKMIDFEGINPRHQKGHNLGQKMANMFQECCVDNHHVILVGSDCVSHTANNLNDAFTKLESNQMVIQPADDGGYILIGQSKYYAQIFDGPKWGGPTVFYDTCKILDANSIVYDTLPKAFDVDIKDDLVKLHSINNKEIKAWLKKYSY